MKNNYNISLTKKAEKFIKKQDKDTQTRIIRSIIECYKHLFLRYS